MSIIRIALLIFCSGLAACCWAPGCKLPDSGTSGTQKAAPVAAPVFPKLDLWLTENKLSITAGQPGIVGYDKAVAQGAVLAYGEGYPVAEAEGPGQKRLTAVRAAEVTAQRNLAEYLARQATNGEIRSGTNIVRLDAFLKGADVAVSEYNADLGKAAVLLRLDLRRFKEFSR